MPVVLSLILWIVLPGTLVAQSPASQPPSSVEGHNSTIPGQADSQGDAGSKAPAPVQEPNAGTTGLEPAGNSSAASSGAPAGGSSQGPMRVAAQGVVLDGQTRRPITGVTVRIPETSYRAISNERGTFRLPPLPPGRYEVVVEAKGYQPRVLRISIAPNSRLPAILLSRPGAANTTNVIEVIAEREVESEPVVERKLSLPELKRSPGSFNDAVRAVQNLPGIARSPFGFLIVRGTEPQDTGYYIDGIRVPNVFHFGGLHTVINTDLLEQVKFLPGNYGVRYGRTMGGVVEAETSEDIPHSRDSYLGVDLLNAQAFTKIPLSEQHGLMLSFRRSYVDAVLDTGLDLVEKYRGEPLSLGFVQAPQYFDYQVLYNRRLGERHFLHAFVFGAHDTVKAVTSPPASVTPAVRGDGEVGTTFSFDKAIVRYRYTGDYLLNQTTLSIGPDINSFGFGSFSIVARNDGFFVRNDLSFRYSPLQQLGIRAGVDGLFGRYLFDFSLPFDPSVQTLDPLDTPDPYTRTISGYFFAPALYLETEFHPNSAWNIITGLRYDPFFFPGIYQTQWLDPRLSITFRPQPATLLKASVGKYGEQPLPFAVDPQFGGNPEVEHQYSIQTALGVEHYFNSFLSLDATFFHSELRQLVVIPTGSTDRTGKPDFTNDGSGRSTGLELLLRHNLRNGLFGWISYTLMKAERLDGIAAPSSSCPPGVATVEQGACWYPFDFDQTHILTLVGSYELPHGWTIGGRFRYSTGVPYTRVSNAYYDVDRNFYSALPAIDGARNDARLPAFHDLTLRVDKLFKLKRTRINGYIEVINVYNRANPEAVDYNFDYTEEIFVSGLPIFPNLGMKAEF